MGLLARWREKNAALAERRRIEGEGDGAALPVDPEKKNDVCPECGKPDAECACEDGTKKNTTEPKPGGDTIPPGDDGKDETNMTTANPAAPAAPNKNDAANNPPAPPAPPASPAPVAASVKELKARFGGADGKENGEFILDCAEKQMTMADANAAFVNRTISAQAAAARGEANLGGEGVGTAPVSVGAGVGKGGGGAGEPKTYAEAVKMVMAREKCGKPRAMALCAREFKALHAEWRAADFPPVNVD